MPVSDIYLIYTFIYNIAWASISQTKLKKILSKNMQFELYIMKKKKVMRDFF